MYCKKIKLPINVLDSHTTLSIV